VVAKARELMTPVLGAFNMLEFGSSACLH